jgi:transposase
VHRHALTEDQWRRLQAILPKQKAGPPATLGDRLFIEAVLFRAKTGMPWRDLPERFGPWKSVYKRFNNWAEKGQWELIFKALQFEVDDVGSIVDGSVVRAHPDASGGKGGVQSNTLGRSRAGFSTLLCIHPSPAVSSSANSIPLVNGWVYPNNSVPQTRRSLPSRRNTRTSADLAPPCGVAFRTLGDIPPGDAVRSFARTTGFTPAGLDHRSFLGLVPVAPLASLRIRFVFVRPRFRSRLLRRDGYPLDLRRAGIMVVSCDRPLHPRQRALLGRSNAREGALVRERPPIIADPTCGLLNVFAEFDVV